MSKFLRLGLVVVIATAGLVVSRGASAAPINVIDCGNQKVAGTGPEVHNPLAPDGLVLPVLGQVVGPEDPCANLNQTLVFIGTADISNGVNFIGSGAGGGGSFDFRGECVMVDWSVPTSSAVLTHAAPVVSGVTSCSFVPGATTGAYGPPTARTPIIREVGDALGGAPVVGPALTLAKAGDATCFDSNGSGSSTFTSKGVGDGGSLTWSSSYSWENSLSNLRGSITDGHGGPSHVFDAKIEAHADPTALAGGLYPHPAQFTTYTAFDATDAGCLEKTVNTLAGLPNTAATGLNDILIVGTATWDARTPQIL